MDRPLHRTPLLITSAEQVGRVPVTVFHLAGDVDVTSYESVQARARQAFQDGMRDLILDLEGVAYMSSAGIRALHDIFNLLRAQRPEESDAAIGPQLQAGTFKSSHLKLARPQPKVREILVMAGLDMFLDIYPDVPAALAAF